MLNIIITGNRAEGKTILALALKFFLNSFTFYRVRHIELNTSNILEEGLEIEYSKIAENPRKYFLAWNKHDPKIRRVQITVINTDY